MKIDTLRFTNLNSLKGSFCLDFTSFPLKDAGIFAITGSTGAGKTTILDAISIALYGQTPRLNSGVSGEIMSRQTGECFSEVEFTVESGRYRSRWSRKRAHGKPKGKLQAPKMELVCLSDNGEQIIEDQNRNCIARVEKLTGLDFKRFSRSVMLAQGNFASFLKAKDNERAELLEKMTGTEIYSYISIEAFERSREEKRILDQLIDRHAEVEIMSESERQQLSEKKTIVSAELTVIQKTIEVVTEQKQLRLGYDSLLSTIVKITIEMKQVEDLFKAKEKAFSRLQLAEIVMPMEVLYRKMEGVSVQHVGKISERDLLLKTIAELEKKITQLDKEQLELEKSKILQTKKWAIREEEIALAEGLDQKIDLEGKKAAIVQQTVTELTTKLVELESRMGQAKAVLDNEREGLGKLEKILQKNARDGELAKVLTCLSQKITELKQNRLGLAEKKAKLLELHNEQKVYSAEHIELCEKQAKILTDADIIKEEINQLESSVTVLLGGLSSEERESELRQHTIWRQTIVDRLALSDEYMRLAGEHETVINKKLAVNVDLIAKRLESEQLGAEKTSQRNVLHQLQEKQKLELRIQKYDEERKKLSADAPCPLCGGIEHPWADSAPGDDSLDQALSDQEEVVRVLTEKFAGVNARVEFLVSQEKQFLSEEILLEQKKAACLSKAQESERYESLNAMENNELASMLADVSEEVKKITDQIEQVRAREKQQMLRIKELAPVDREVSSIANSLGQLSLALKNTDKAIAQLNEAVPRVSKGIATVESDLAEALRPFALDVPDVSEEDHFIEMLQDRWYAFDKACQNIVVQKQSVVDHEKSYVIAEKDVEAVKENLKKQESEMISGGKYMTEMQTKRKGLLESYSVAKARDILGAERDTFNRKCNDVAILVSKNLAEHKAKEESLAAIEKEIAVLKAQHDQARKELSAQVEKTEFSSIESIVDFFMGQDEYASLKKLRQDIRDRQVAAQARLREAQKSKDAIEGEAALLSLNDIADTLRKKQEALSAKNKEVGGIDEVFKQQEILWKSQRQQAERIVRQKKEYARWLQLNELLGSADGKKYRRFAQGLTLDHLLYLANLQLTRLNDRYLLQRGRDELEVQVVDTYQADTIRSTDTLSGGEEFLVSLALALGLSGLTGNASMIDSLFLDEGFGTLDTQTLETAIAALASLHESGKTIGVISHVDALKERIPVQIQVQKMAGGFSTLGVVG